ncbi:MAG: Ig-like domain-containing protein, partial [Gammaproteobacteria bacterium]
VYVYTYNGSAWSKGTALLPTSLPSHSQYGYSIALSSNGSTGLVALIGAVQGGAVYVSSYNGSSWSNPTALSTSGITQTAGTFGFSVALSANGQTAVVGSGVFNGGTGAAYVYTETGSTWSTPTTLSRPTGASAFGWSVGITPSGTEVFVGAPFGTPNSGAIYAYTYSGSSWSAGTALPTSSVQPQAALGYALAVGADGQEVIGGAVAANGGTGGAYVYESPTAVTLSVSATPTSVVPGNNLTFNLTFTNADTASGGLPAVNLTDVVLTDTLPTGTTYVSSNAANGSCSHSGSTVTCALASLPAGNNSQNPWQPSITVKTPSTASRLTNTVSATADEPLTGTTNVSTTVINDVKPTVTNGNLSTSPNTAVSGTLSATPGFTGQKLTFTIVEQPSNGTLSAFNTATGAFTYTPKAGFTGTDLFIFTAGDGIVTSAPAAESITVSTPTGPPTANNGSVTTAENTPVTGVLQYLGSGSLTFAIVSQPTHGSITTPNSGGVFTYTPNTGYSGIDTFTFTVANSLGKSNTATETVTVSATLNQPVAADVSLTAYENTPLSGTLPAVDAAGNPLSFAVTQPAHGSVTVTAGAGAFTYTPASGYTGDDSFTFTATDTVTNLTSNAATISIEVKATPSSGSSGGGSGSSGKSGGGALGFLSLGLLGMGWGWRRRRLS